MDNHVHLVLFREDGRISRCLQRLLTAYAVHFNSKYEHSGHVFQNRFFAKPCRSERYLRALTRYVHLNPVLAGLAPCAGAWPWSSHRDFLHPHPDSLSRPERVLALFGDSAEDFARFVDGADLKELPAPGNLSPFPEEEPAPSPKEAAAVTPLMILALRLDADLRLLTERSKRPEALAARKRFVRQALREGSTEAAIARFLGMSRSAVAMMVLRDGLRRECDACEERP